MQATPDRGGQVKPPSPTVPLAAQEGAARMSVRAVAKAAYDAAQSDTVTAARNAMLALFDNNTEFSGIPMLEVHAPPETAGYTLVIFADDDSDVVLGVQQPAGSTEWAVWLVRDDGSGGWEKLGDQVTSLEHLWVLIDTYLPAAPPWEAGVAYAVGDQVSHNGVVYECIQAHTSQVGWEPPNAPSLWSAV